MGENSGTVTSGERMFKRMALIGVGLIGSSISHAARRAGLVGEIVGCSSTAETRDKAEALGLVIDEPMPTPPTLFAAPT